VPADPLEPPLVVTLHCACDCVADDTVGCRKHSLGPDSHQQLGVRSKGPSQRTFPRSRTSISEKYTAEDAKFKAISVSTTEYLPHQAGRVTCTSRSDPRMQGDFPSTPGAKATLVRLDAVDVRWSPKARRWRLEVPWGAAPRLTVPVGTRHADVERFLAEHQCWIVEQRERQVPRLGLEERAINESDARIRAREIVSAIAADEAEKIGVGFERIRIGGQRTLWGSCSPRGALSFNWRLVLAPFEVLDYVVVHEVCHLRVPNHSRRFWALVERRRPCWRDQRDWLRIHGPELLGFTPKDASPKVGA
jgi:predicted metal-dependent hydrolase